MKKILLALACLVSFNTMAAQANNPLGKWDCAVHDGGEHKRWFGRVKIDYCVEESSQEHRRFWLEQFYLKNYAPRK